jgi:hypothetical protein
MDSLSTSPPNFALTPPQVLKPKHLWMAHPKYGVAPPLDLLESQTPCSDHITRPEVHRSSTTATPSSSRRIEDSGGVRATREQSYRIQTRSTHSSASFLTPLSAGPRLPSRPDPRGRHEPAKRNESPPGLCPDLSFQPRGVFTSFMGQDRPFA